MATVNYPAILVSSFVYMAIGAFWYSPIGFGKLWQKLSGVTEKEMGAAKKRGMWLSYVITFIGAFLASYAIARILYYVSLGSDVSAMTGITIAVLIWFGFVATVTLGTVLWEGKSWKLYSLNNAYQLLSLAISGLIIGAWR